MSEEELIKYIKGLTEITKENNKRGMEVGVEISVNMAEQVLNLIEKQDKMIDLMAETMALDIMYADEDKDVQTMKEKIKEKYRKDVEENDNSKSR